MTQPVLFSPCSHPQAQRGADSSRSVVRLVLEQRQNGQLGQFLDALYPLQLILPEAKRNSLALARVLLGADAGDEAPFTLPATLEEAAQVARRAMIAPNVLAGIDSCVATMLYQAMISPEVDQPIIPPEGYAS
jgi:hypothetical protein